MGRSHGWMDGSGGCWVLFELSILFAIHIIHTINQSNHRSSIVIGSIDHQCVVIMVVVFRYLLLHHFLSYYYVHHFLVACFPSSYIFILKPSCFLLLCFLPFIHCTINMLHHQASSLGYYYLSFSSSPSHKIAADHG